jgi:hypothetical protein
MINCKTLGCSAYVTIKSGHDFCDVCNCRSSKESSNTELSDEQTSGADNDYWVAQITNPKRLEPCSVECDDLIELFQMSYQEGEAFKAHWRNGQLRLGKGKPGDTHLRNAQKFNYYSGRQLVMEHRKAT